MRLELRAERREKRIHKRKEEELTEVTEKQSKNWGMACHLIALTAFIGVPFGNLLGPLVLWLCLRNSFPSVEENGKESLNFQISITIYSLIAIVLCFVIVGFFLLAALIVADIILVVIASIKASNGESYKYPYTIRLIK